MKKLKKGILLCLGFTLILMASCISIEFVSGGQKLPETDIIYMAGMQYADGENEIGFINADRSMNELVVIENKMVKPVWTDENVVFCLSGSEPYETTGYPAYWDITAGIAKMCSKNLQTFDQIQSAENINKPYEVFLFNVGKIIKYDISKCKQTQSIIDVNGQFGDYKINGFSYHGATNELLYGLIQDPYGNERSYTIIKRNLDTDKETVLAEGTNPAWSPTGEYIAYIGLDGVYVMDSNGGYLRRLVDREFFDPWELGSPEDYLPILRWSPDGKWLLYHFCDTGHCSFAEKQKMEVFKLNVLDGTEELLFTGGIFPMWRP